MSLFSKLFGGSKSAPEAEPETYAGFTITAAPIKEANGWRIAARIEKDIAGVRKTHNLVRADVISDRAEAEALSLQKARLVIDQMGETLFG